MMRRVMVLIGMGLFAGCAHRQIPGTQIDDTTDTRAILDLIEHFRAAVEAKDPAQIVKLVDVSFKDDGGTSTPWDDLEYSTLASKLAERFAKVDTVKLDVDVRKIVISEDNTTATAIYRYDSRFEILTANKRQMTDSELKQMSLKRVDDGWKITSGI